MSEHPPRGKRRRNFARFPLRVPLSLSCVDWQQARELFSANVGRGGLFVPCGEPLPVGERVSITLTLPDGDRLPLKGRVVHIQSEEPRGVGVELDAATAQRIASYQALIDRAAKGCEAVPAKQPFYSPGFGESQLFAIDEQSVSVTLPTRRYADFEGLLRFDEVEDLTAGHALSESEDTVRAFQSPLKWSSVRPPLIAIDFGTARSSVAVVIGSQSRVIKLTSRDWSIPSAVGFVRNGVITGQPARDLSARQPDRVVPSPLRLLGRSFDDPAIQAYLATIAAPSVRGAAGEILIEVDGRHYAIPQLCAPILGQIKFIAEQQLGVEISEAVLAVPVSFPHGGCDALRAAAKMVGLEVRELIDQPTAAAIAQRGELSEQKTVAVFDFGGGTFEFSVIDVTRADYSVIATAGDVWLGGDDLDAALADAAAAVFVEHSAVDLRNQIAIWQRLLLEAERAKCALSMENEVRLSLSDVCLGSDQPRSLSWTVSKQRLDDLSKGLIERALGICRTVLRDAALNVEDLDAVYLAGGSCSLPALRHAVGQFFGRAPRAVVHPKRAVVVGAAMYAADLRNAQLGRANTPTLQREQGARLVVGRGDSKTSSSGERRHTARVRLEVDVDYFTEHNFYLGFSQNIGCGGLFVATADGPAIGTELDVAFSLPGGRTRFVVPARVRWRREPNPAAPQWAAGVGVEFVALSPDVEGVLKEFIKHREPLFFDEPQN
ncbi:MAG: Hsp70 family protein [Deltaproteobacteria bacterium]|nr:Hsp70 family protein [Deltaproteobacteria bacterium]